MAKFGGYKPGGGGGGGGFGGGGNMQQLMKQAQQMQTKMAEAQQEVEDAEIECSSGSGLVKIVMNGNKKVSSVTIDPKAVDPDDIEMLEDLIIAALNEGYEKADALKDEKMGQFGGMGF